MSCNTRPEKRSASVPLVQLYLGRVVPEPVQAQSPNPD